MTLSREDHAALVDSFYQEIGPIMRGILGTETDKTIRYDPECWDAFIEALTGPLTREILYGPNTRGPHCVSCDAEGNEGEFDADHEFSPDGKLGNPPCLCRHPSQSHVKGERGENHPQYWAFEMLQRGTTKDASGRNFVNQPGVVRGLWTLLLDFDKYRDGAIRRFKVSRGPVP